MTAPKLDMQRIKVNVQGYDATGAYWGAGPDVFIATTGDGSDEITVRARNVAEARAKVAAELARQPGEARLSNDAIGGKAPRKSRYEIDWHNSVTGETVRLRITHARDYLSKGTDHIEVHIMSPKTAVIPITETGYRSHFLNALDLINAGGPVTFVTAWIAREASSKAWAAAATAKAQGNLFQWAATKPEVGSPKTRHPSKPATQPRKKPAPGRAP